MPRYGRAILREPGLGEAILRELGGVAKDVGRQIQSNQDFNRQSAIDQQGTEADRRQQLIENELAGRRETRQQETADLRFAESQDRILQALGGEKPLTIKDQEAELFANDRPAYYEHIRLKAEAGRGPEKTTKPKKRTLTPLSLKRLVDEREKEQTTDVLKRAIEPDIEGLRAFAQKGLDRRIDVDSYNPFTTFGTQSAPDSSGYRLLQEFEQAISPESRLSRADSVLTGQLFPELDLDAPSLESVLGGILGPQPQTEELGLGGQTPAGLGGQPQGFGPDGSFPTQAEYEKAKELGIVK